MHAIRSSLTVLAGVTWLVLANAAETVHINVDASNPPFMSERDRRPSGIYPALLIAAFDRIRRPLVLEAKPWTRALLEIDMGKAGIGGIYKNEERAAKYDFSDALLTENVAVYFNKAKPIDFKMLANLDGRRIGVIRGWSYGDAFDTARKEGRFAVEEVSTDTNNFQKLAHGRVDAVLAIEEAGRTIIAAQGLNNIERSRVWLASNSAHLAFNKSARQKALLAEFDRAIGEMRRDGTLERIVRDELAR